MSFVRVRRKGQITIPAEARAKLGLEEDDFLYVEVEDNRIVLTPFEIYIKEAVQEGLDAFARGEVTPAFASMEEFEVYMKTEAYLELIDSDE